VDIKDRKKLLANDICGQYPENGKLLRTVNRINSGSAAEPAPAPGNKKREGKWAHFPSPGGQ
jgi:hypothetical protein